MKSIFWITGDYFLDVDMAIVPELKKNYDIRWVVVRTGNSPREVSFVKAINEIITIRHRSISPMCIFSYRKVINSIKKANPDIVYVNYLGMPYFFPLLCNMIDIRKVIFMAHNVEPRPTWNWQYKLYYPYIFRHLYHVHIPSTHNIPFIEDHYPNLRYTYIPMMVKSFGEPKRKANTNKKVRFLFFGHVMRNKRLDHLIRAYCELSDEEKSKSELYVYGKCAEPEKYLLMAKDENSIHLSFGYAPNEIIAQVFTESSFLVLPYDNVDQSGPSMIAYNYNLPLICSDLEGFKEIVEDGVNGFLYAKNDIDSLRKVLQRCIVMSSDDYQALKENLADFVCNNFTLDVISRKYSAMFDQFIKES